jgi:drug/metabolite transporter (DMT)-like permease
MNHKLTPSTALLLTIPPLLWGGNIIVGRMVRDAVPPMTLNLLRWVIALLILLPLGGHILRRGSGLWSNWRRYAMLGLLGIGLYNSLQYLALQSSTPINVSLIAAGLPVWTLLLGSLFFGAKASRKQVIGAAMSIVGVLLVLSRGEWRQLLALRLVAGDIYMTLASVIWAFYSWLLTQPKDPPAIRADWASFLLAQVIYGALWSAALAAEELAESHTRVEWSWPLAAALLFVAAGPAVVAFRCWDAGVQRAGPTIGALFFNLTPLFAALMSSAFLNEMPHLYHVAAFMLIVGGIMYSLRR